MHFSVSKNLTWLLRFVALVLFATASVAVIHPGVAQADDFLWNRNFDSYEGDGFFITLVKTHPTQQVISIRGNATFVPYNFNKILKVLKNIDPRKEIILDVSGYGGGLIMNAERIAPEIKAVCEAKRNKHDRTQSCDITTYLGVDQCSSSCIIPYMAGKKRLACRTSKFGFHSTSFLGFKTPSSNSISMLLENGVFKSWITKNIRMLQSLDITFLRPGDMVGSNIVTDIDYTCDYTADVYKSAYDTK